MNPYFPTHVLVSTGFKRFDKESIVFHQAINGESPYTEKGTLAVGTDTLHFRGKRTLLSVAGSYLKGGWREAGGHKDTTEWLPEP